MSHLYISLPDRIGRIAPEIYGHFSEHIGGVFYDGIWVGEDSSVRNYHGIRAELVDKLRAIEAPVIRWPGGCFAEIYDWRDGIGPRSDRPTRVNWWTASDNRYEPNQVGTHEFVEFCRLVGAEPYFAANVTSTTPLDIRDWVDYCNSPQGSTTMARLREKNGSPEPFNVKYWGVGNENWGGGGNMTPEVYCDTFRRYSAIMDNTAGNLCLVGCGPNAADYEWTHRFMENLRSSERHMRGYSVHYYCGGCGDPVNFSQNEWYKLIEQADQMDTIINRHWSIIRGFGMEGNARLFVDEWGCWHPGGSGPSHGYNLFEQQSTMRDAVVSALTLNTFNNNCDKVAMANTAQLVNNLHCLFLASGDKLCVTPTYHVYDMYRHHKCGEAVRTVNDAGKIVYDFGGRREINRITASASVKDDILTITAANIDAENEVVLEPDILGASASDTAEITLLHCDDYHAHNDLDNPDVVVPVKSECPGKRIILPPASVAAIRIKLNK